MSWPAYTELIILPYSWNEREYKYKIIESTVQLEKLNELDKYMFVL